MILNVNGLSLFIMMLETNDIFLYVVHEIQFFWRGKKWIAGYLIIIDMLSAIPKFVYTFTTDYDSIVVVDIEDGVHVSRYMGNVITDPNARYARNYCYSISFKNDDDVRCYKNSIEKWFDMYKCTARPQ